MKTLIVTAANERYVSLFRGLLASLTQWPTPLADGIAVLDLGLSAATLTEIKPQVSHVLIPRWDLPVAIPIQEQKPWLRAMVCRPFLPAYFPGYDIYLWIDADAWVQEPFAIRWLIDAAKGGAMGIAPSVDRSYVFNAQALNWRTRNLNNYFGEEALRLYQEKIYLNTGVFALRANAPHWQAWQRYFAIGLANSPETISDQSILNYAVWKDNLPIHPLPALCNWLCHYAMPTINRENGKLCEPHIPHRPLGIIHLASRAKQLRLRLQNGTAVHEVNLEFGGRAALFHKTQPL